MNAQLRSTLAVGAAIAATLSAYAVAQRAPADDKAPAAQATTPACPDGAKHCSKPDQGASGHNHGSMMGPSKEACGMHGDCMHGQGVMDPGSCPMAAAGGADVSIENTKDGAVIRLSAKDPAKVQEVQRLAAMIAKHLEPGAATPAAQGAHSHSH